MQNLNHRITIRVFAILAHHKHIAVRIGSPKARLNRIHVILQTRATQCRPSALEYKNTRRPRSLSADQYVA